MLKADRQSILDAIFFARKIILATASFYFSGLSANKNQVNLF
ncbi:hypothetical protein O9399_12890 [Proteus mirabilis]|nr:hypothetical protein [Proteus mirabilis]